MTTSSSSCRRVLGVVLACSLLSPAASVAQTRKIAPAAVALDRRLQSEAASAGLALQRFVANDVRFEVVDLAARARDPKRAEKAKAAAALVAEALNLIDEMKEKAALQKADEALALCEAADLTTAFPGLLDALAARAFALHSLGDKAKTKAELARLFALEAGYKLDPRRVSPGLQALADEARAKVTGAPKVALEVRSSPASAGVWVDGAFRGVTPAVVAGLAPGSHYVVLSAPGYELSQTTQAAGLGVPAEISLAPAAPETQRGLLDLLARLQSSSPLGADGSGGALAKWAGADEAVVAALSRRGEATWAVVTRFAPDGKVLATVEQPLSKPEAVEDLAREALAHASASSAGASATSTTGSATKAAEPSSGIGTGRAIGIALGALAVASLGGGIGLGVVAEGKATDARNTPLVDQATYKSNADAARGMALGANVLYGVAGVCAGLATWLIVTGGPGGGAQAAQQHQSSGDLGFALAPVQGGALLSVSGGFP